MLATGSAWQPAVAMKFSKPEQADCGGSAVAQPRPARHGLQADRATLRNKSRVQETHLRPATAYDRFETRRVSSQTDTGLQESKAWRTRSSKRSSAGAATWCSSKIQARYPKSGTTTPVLAPRDGLPVRDEHVQRRTRKNAPVAIMSTVTPVAITETCWDAGGVVRPGVIGPAPWLPSTPEPQACPHSCSFDANRISPIGEASSHAARSIRVEERLSRETQTGKFRLIQACFPKKDSTSSAPMRTFPWIRRKTAGRSSSRSRPSVSS